MNKQKTVQCPKCGRQAIYEGYHKGLGYIYRHGALFVESCRVRTAKDAPYPKVWRGEIGGIETK